MSTPPAKRESQAAMTPSTALETLKAGNVRFLEGRRKTRNLYARVLSTAEGQSPFAAVVSCMDSRGPVEIIFDQGIGDVFSLRVGGNIIGRDFLGSLEFATKVAGAKLIVVMGHTSCGAVGGAVDGVNLGNLTALLAEIQPAIAQAGTPRGTSIDKAYVDRVAEQNVRLGMKGIREKSPVIRQMLEAGAIELVGAMYEVETGRVVFYSN